jgi:hypothetical protein
VEASREAALSALALPSELGRFLGLAAAGKLEVRARALDDGVQALYSVFQQLLWGALGGTATILAVIFDGRGQGTARGFAIGGAIVCGCLLVLALMRGGRFLRSRR